MISTYIHSGSIPDTPLAGVVGDIWHGADNPKTYRKQGNRNFSKTSIRYDFNSLGYRADEFKSVAGVKILSLGCSVAFGLGINREDSYVQLFCNHVGRVVKRPVFNWNLSWCGKSNDYIARMLVISLSVLQPDIVLINFTAIGRKELFDLDGRCIDYFPAHTRQQSEDLVTEALRRGMDRIASPLDDLMNFTRNFKIIELAMSRQRKLWMYSILVPKQVKQVENLLPQRNRVSGTIKMIDTARDGAHPGPLSHRLFAEQIINTYQRLQQSTEITFSDCSATEQQENERCHTRNS